MIIRKQHKLAIVAAAVLLTLASALIFIGRPMRAADHAESTSVAGDPGADLADVFAFLGPHDNSKVVLAMDVGDNVNANDVPLGNSFPFFAPPQQPRGIGVIDDNTRN